MHHRVLSRLLRLFSADVYDGSVKRDVVGIIFLILLLNLLFDHAMYLVRSQIWLDVIASVLLVADGSLILTSAAVDARVVILQVGDAAPVEEASAARLDAGPLFVASQRLDVLDVGLPNRVRQ